MPEKKNGYAELKSAISNNSLENIYIIHGPETYLKEYYLKQMKRLILNKNNEDFDLKRIDGQNTNTVDIINAVESIPVVGERSFVEIRNFDIYKQNEQEAKELAELFKSVPKYCCLAFVYDSLEFKSDKRRKIHSLVEKYANVVEIPVQGQSDLVNWICRRVSAYGSDITREDAEYLIHFSGNLMSVLSSEIDKLTAYCEARTITRADIEYVAIPLIEAAVFSVVNEITRRNYAKAAELISHLFDLRESPIMLLAVIASQFRKMYTARLIYESGKNASYLKDFLKLRSDYQARTLMQSSQSVSLKWCEDAVAACTDYDFRMKSSSLDDNQLFVSLLLNLIGS